MNAFGSVQRTRPDPDIAVSSSLPDLSRELGEGRSLFRERELGEGRSLFRERELGEGRAPDDETTIATPPATADLLPDKVLADVEPDDPNSGTHQPHSRPKDPGAPEVTNAIFGGGDGLLWEAADGSMIAGLDGGAGSSRRSRS